MKTKIFTKLQPATPFIALGLTAIISGGMLSAFYASTPSRSLMWVSAFLVLVLGVGQIALGLATRQLRSPPKASIALAIAVSYSLGGLLIMLGALAKPSWQLFVPIGSLLLLAALLGHLKLSYGHLRPWWKYSYLLVVLVLLVCIPIGNYLSYS